MSFLVRILAPVAESGTSVMERTKDDWRCMNPGQHDEASAGIDEPKVSCRASKGVRDWGHAQYRLDPDRSRRPASGHSGFHSLSRLGELAGDPDRDRRARSDGRRVGKACVSTCRSWWSPSA